MKPDFDHAIGRTGGVAILPWLDNAAVTVSIQPDGFYGDGREETGSGTICRYKFFTPYSDTAEKLREGSELVFLDCRYIVENIATVHLGDRAVYRRGTLLLERGTGDDA